MPTIKLKIDNPFTLSPCLLKYLRALNLYPLPLPYPLPTYQPQPAGFMQNADRLLQSFTQNS
jgi:hypothetical protein